MKAVIGICLLALLQVNAQAQCLEGNCYEGIGSYLYPSGARYVGEFRDGKINGKGTLHFSNGNVYKGEWVDFYREGRGELSFTDGGSYVGQFKASKFNGFGEYSYPNGDTYKGNWKEDLANGQGIYLFYDGDKYEGSFKDGAFHGQGTMFYKNGSKYVGDWAHNKKDGIGEFYKADGQIVSGEWEDGKYVNVLTEAPTTAVAAAAAGEFIYPSGDRYVGALVDGKPDGEGVVHYVNGNRYEGQWQYHGPHGKGTMYYHYGRQVGGIWKYGTLVKEIRKTGPKIEAPVDVLVDRDPAVKIRVLIVGVAEYDHLPRLTFTDDDASEVYSFYRSERGGALPDDQIEILLDKDASREGIINAMHRTFLRADENDVIVMYFSGHGFDGSFVPFDYNGNSNLLGHDEIREIVSKSKAKHKLVLADACHSGSMQNNLWAARAVTKSQLNNYYQKFEEEDGGIALLMSSKKEEYSLEDHGLRQGIFSHFLIKGLEGEANKDNDAFITIKEISEYVTTKVSNYTGGAQNPTLFGKINPNMPIAYQN